MHEHQQTQQSKNPEQSSQRRISSTSHTIVSNPTAIIQRARINPKSLTPADVLQLQRTIGNRAVGRLLSEIGLIPSRTKQAPPVQMQTIPEEDKEPLQGKFSEPLQRQEIPEEEEEPLQGKFENDSEQEACLSCSIPLIQKQEENHTGMPDNLKVGVESLSGIDMSNVRVHYNSSKPAEVGALAYTQGSDIHVAPGQEKHLPHEAWHVVQQAQGRVRPTVQLKDVMLNDDVKLEREADVLGETTTNMIKQVKKSKGRDISSVIASVHPKFLGNTLDLALSQNVDPRRPVQLREIKHKPGDEEVELSAFILSEDENQTIEDWPLKDSLKSNESETLIGHSAGNNLDDETAEALADELIPKMDESKNYNLRILACKAGKVDEEGRSFASRLKDSLNAKSRHASVTAPKESLWIVGNKQYVQPTGNMNLLSLPGFRTSERESLDEYKKVMMKDHIEEAKKLAIKATGENRVQTQELSKLWNEQVKSIAGGGVSMLQGKDMNDIEKLKSALDMCINYTKNGYKKLINMLKQIIEKCGGEYPSEKELDDYEIINRVGIRSEVSKSVIEQHSREFSVESQIGGDESKWTTV